MSKKFPLLIVCCALIFNCFKSPVLFAQNRAVIDSLLQVLEYSNQDTNQVNTLNSLAAKYERTNIDSTLLFAQKALDLATDLKYIRGMAYANFELGYAYRKQMNYPMAIKHWDEQFRLYKKLGNKKGMLTYYGNIGDVSHEQGLYDTAIEQYFKQLAIAEEMNDKKYMASSYNNIALVYQKQNSYEKSIDYLLMALELREQTGNALGKAMIYNNLGLAYKSLDDYDKAISYFKEALAIADSMDYERGMAFCYGNIAGMHRIQGQFNDAQEYYLKTLSISEKQGNLNANAIVYGNLALVNIGLADSVATTKEQRINFLNKAIEYGTKAMMIAKEMGFMPREQGASRILKMAYTRIGNYKKAMEYAEIYMITQDSMFNQEKTKAIQEMSTKYETEKKNVEIQELRIKDLENQNIKRLFLLIIISLGVISILLFFFFRQKVRTNKILDKKNYQLNKLNETQSRLMSIISHDLKAPLSAFFSITSSLKSKIDKMDSKSIDDYFNRMLNSALAVKLQLENLLVWSITQTTDINVHKNSYNLSILVQKVIVILEEFSNEKSLALENKVDENIEIHTDGRLLSIVLNNITTNAIKFSENNSSVEILATKTEGNLLISVKDYGCGMSKENLANLFAGQNNMKHANKGTGLGLIVCKDIMEKLGGKIWAESEEGKGTSFYIEIGG